ncbi:uncharacterized protein LOC121880483 [Homarus americanus]|uniref:uncharacterized protein LOC121880483 n=1 Tax=Homarus americanus TaxID=6706 RepID=UPI001C4482AF|nr:uncharacterized protein LOC121880483 [Homarus americanus]
MVSRAKGSTGTMALHCSQAKLWVKTHYERHEDGVVAKSVMYKHYEDYCRDQGRNIMETSIFGRVVKSVFPDVTIRRLGGRDNLKYYYCGIQAKESSPHVIDNATTTRPKRRLRKREVVTDKTDVHRCLLWLHNNYCVGPDSSVIKSEVYDRYVLDCIASAADPLPMQYFGMVVSHAFPHITKRKLGPRANQQKFYFGIQERPAPLPLDTVPPELMREVDFMFNNGRLCYREEVDPDDDDEDDDDRSCRSPVSDTSEGSLRDAHTPYSGEPPGAHANPYFHTYIKEEPVNYSLQHLKLKDEPLDIECTIKVEPLDLHIPRDVHDMDTSYMPSPERSPSVATSISDSPSPSVKDQKTRKLYKPRFHIISGYNDDVSWNSDPDPKMEKDGVQYCNNSVHSQWETFLRDWLSRTFEECERMCVNRDQVYAYYEKVCEMTGTIVLPLTYFDETVLKVFRGVVTMIHPSEKTFYEGIRVQIHSDFYSRIEELIDGEPCIHHLIDGEASMQQHSMELSPPPGAAPRISPQMLDEDEAADERYADNYRDPPDEELHSTPEVLRDGKYYLRMWLTDNFESLPDSCVLKADAYRHYEIYAKTIKQTPFEMNVFGKIVRQVFPKVTIRRLGGRVKPQYHYCGIAVKTSSPLFQYMSGRDPAQRSRKKEIATDNKSAEIVIDWLRSHYEPGTERIIMKSAVFSNYCAYCKSINENPVTLNYFGKLVKHCFPNVEVRKCGGRSEPTWYYFGLVPRGEMGAVFSSSHHHHHHHDLQDDIQVPQTTLSEPRQLSPMGHDLGHSIPSHTTSPIPISLNKGEMGAHLAAPPNGSYSSSMMLQSVLLNQHVNLAQSPLLNRRSPFHGSPGEGLLEASYQRPPHDLCGASPTRTYPDHLASHSPAAEGSSLQELRRQLLARSPYEPVDVPSDNMFSRSPGDTSAQYCRSPRELLDGEATLPAHSPADTSIMFSHSPLEANYPGAVRPRSSLAGGSGGGQVVPRLQPQQLVFDSQAHKRHRGQPQMHLDHYDMMNDIQLE